jgi:predicted nucleotidyltransferase
MKLNYPLLQALNSNIKARMIKFLLTHEASMSEREIASVLKISHMSVNRTLRELADLNFVNYIAVGKAHLWKVNRKSYAFKALSRLIKGVSTISGPMEDFRRFLLRNMPKNLVKKAVLFGSVAKGTERADSDIDIFILAKNPRAKSTLKSKMEALSGLCFELYGNRLSPYILTEREMKRKKSMRLISEINKGIEIFPGKVNR